MQTLNAKQEALDAIARLPDNVDLDEIVYRLYVLDAIHKGLKEIEEGKPGLSVDELRAEIARW
jgi:hypothetical protein